MFHENRVWSVGSVESAEELAKKLTSMTWCCCNGFSIGDYLWLNDATCPDGAQEYAVLKRDSGKLVQIESITFSWCEDEEALRYIRDTLAGKDDLNSFRKEVDPVLQTPAEHGSCGHCA